MQYLHGSDWIQLLVFCIGLLAITKPMGIYLLRVLDPDVEGGLGIFERILKPIERLVYLVAGIDPKKQQNWKQFGISIVLIGAVTTLLSYGMYRLQDKLPLKQNISNLGATVDSNGVINGGGKVPSIIAFIQGASFSTNTDWQSYEPEQMFTHFSQTVPTALHFFFSSAVGIAAGAAVVRGVARRQTTNIGNFWVDLPLSSHLHGLRTARCLAGDTNEFPRIYAGDGTRPIRSYNPGPTHHPAGRAGTDGLLLCPEGPRTKRPGIHRCGLRPPL